MMIPTFDTSMMARAVYFSDPFTLEDRRRLQSVGAELYRARMIGVVGALLARAEIDAAIHALSLAGESL